MAFAPPILSWKTVYHGGHQQDKPCLATRTTGLERYSFYLSPKPSQATAQRSDVQVTSSTNSALSKAD